MFFKRCHIPIVDQSCEKNKRRYFDNVFNSFLMTIKNYETLVFAYITALVFMWKLNHKKIFINWLNKTMIILFTWL